MSAEVLQRSQEQHLAQMAEALEAMHRDVAETSDRRRMQARARRASKSKPPNFSVGNFVLVAVVTQHANKLAINWQGPKRIVRAISDWEFEVESLNPPQATTTHHVSRLRFYAEASRGVTEDLLQYAFHSQGGHLVEAFQGVRFNPSNPALRIIRNPIYGGETIQRCPQQVLTQLKSAYRSLYEINLSRPVVVSASDET